MFLEKDLPFYPLITLGGGVVLFGLHNSSDREIRKTTKFCYSKFFREREAAGHVYTDKQEECVSS